MADEKKVRFVALKIVSCIAALLLIALTIRIEGIKRAHKQDVEKAGALHRAQGERLAFIEAVKKRRADFFKSRFVLDFPAKYAFAAADFTRRLSLVVSPDMRLKEVQIQPSGHNFSFSLHCYLAAPDRETFRRFYRRLEGFEDLVHLDFSEEQGHYTVTGEVAVE